MRALPWLWALAIAAAAWMLSSGWGPALVLPDPLHVVMHLALFGVLAGMLARPCGLDGALGLTLAAGFAVELAQMHASGRWLGEVGYDMAVDLVGAVSGLAVARLPGVAERIGYWLHPVGLAPVAMFGVGWASGLPALESAVWTCVVMVCIAPAVLAWGFGVRAGWYPHVDRIDAAQRSVIFAVASACAWALAGLTWRWGPPAFVVMTLGLAGVMSLLVVVTRLGFKMSGHVVIPLLLAVAAWPWTMRGAGVLLLAGALLSWARVAADRHRPIEVAASWAVAMTALAVSIAVTG